jgi:uncharacterized protein (DUF1499 family)
VKNETVRYNIIIKERHVNLLRAQRKAYITALPKRDYGTPIKYSIDKINKVIDNGNALLSDVLEEKTRLEHIPEKSTDEEVKKILTKIINVLIKVNVVQKKENRYRVIYVTFLLSRYAMYYFNNEKYYSTTIDKAEEFLNTDEVDYRDLITFTKEKIPTLEECLGIFPI